MHTLRFPDGREQAYEPGLTFLAVAEQISPKFAQRIIAAKLNDTVYDMSVAVPNDGAIVFLTGEEPEGLEVLRHSCAHLLAQAAKTNISDSASYDRTGDSRRFLLRFCDSASLNPRRSTSPRRKNARACKSSADGDPSSGF